MFAPLTAGSPPRNHGWALFQPLLENPHPQMDPPHGWGGLSDGGHLATRARIISSEGVPHNAKHVQMETESPHVFACHFNGTIYG